MSLASPAVSVSRIGLRCASSRVWIFDRQSAARAVREDLPRILRSYPLGELARRGVDHPEVSVVGRRDRVHLLIPTLALRQQEVIVGLRRWLRRVCTSARGTPVRSVQRRSFGTRRSSTCDKPRGLSEKCGSIVSIRDRWFVASHWQALILSLNHEVAAAETGRSRLWLQAWHGANDASRRRLTIYGIGAISASGVAIAIPDPTRSGRAGSPRRERASVRDRTARVARRCSVAPTRGAMGYSDVCSPLPHPGDAHGAQEKWSAAMGGAATFCHVGEDCHCGACQRGRAHRLGVDCAQGSPYSAAVL